MSLRKINVLHMGLEDGKGGIEWFLYNMSRRIDWDRFQFDFLCYGKSPAFGEELRSMGARLIEVPDRKNVIAYWKFLRRVLTDYNVVHLHKNSPGDFLPILASCGSSTKVIVHAHNTAANHDLPALLISLGRGVVNRYSDQSLACSLVAAKWLFGNEAEKVQIVPNGIDIDAYAFNPAVREEVRAKCRYAGMKVIGCIGRFNVQKNQLFLVDVLSELLNIDKKFKLVFLGDGEQKRNVARAFERAGMRDKVEFKGSVDGVSRYLQAFDAVVMPSLYEGLPLTAIETQASGLPLVVSDTVTEEIDVTPLVKRMNLRTNTPKEWACVLAESITTRGGVPFSSRLRVFDARNTARRLEKVYLSLVKED